MTTSLAAQQVKQALAFAGSEAGTLQEKVEVLVEIAMGLQVNPRTPQQLHEAIALYDRASELCPEDAPLLAARIDARRGTALQAVPDPGPEFLLRAQSCFESAAPVLERDGLPEEIAELRMNLGLVLQTLSSFHRARIGDAIAQYQRALRVFDRDAFPTEYAILQNNLATAYLSIPMSDERAKMREALAVKAFETALEVVNLIDHPSEFAMLQNNLGNALQYAASGHAVQNNLRALDAYDEALKVRTRRSAPLAYANTIANKANCLLNLPDDPARPENGNAGRAGEAIGLYREALSIFDAFNDEDRAHTVREVLEQLRGSTGTGTDDHAGDGAFGESRI